MLHFDVALKFSIEIKAISGTLFLFSGIFVANLLFNLIQIKLANPIELLHGGKQGEKEPKTKIIMTIIGVAALGGGYYIAQTTESPLTAMGLFFCRRDTCYHRNVRTFYSRKYCFIETVKEK